MNDLPPNVDDANGNNNTPPDNKPTNIWVELCLGLGSGGASLPTMYNDTLRRLI